MTKEKKTTSPAGESFQIKKGEPLKNLISRDSLREHALAIKTVYKPFKVDDFIDSIIDETWEDLELKARVRQVTINMGKYLPASYPEALAVLDKVAAGYRSGIFILGMSLPDFVEVFGQDEENWDLSMGALARYTVNWSSEMAVRPFIINHEKRMMKQMLAWSRHENEHVRRLSSEGCRPALPWAQALPGFKKNPTPVLPILEQLKKDPSQYVRKSVANNINDISKTHPNLVIKLAKDWYGDNEFTDWIVKHGCRTLLKKGNREALALFGVDDDSAVNVDGFAVETSVVSIGGDLIFNFSISAKDAAKARLEYGIDYVKANGKRSRKIFKISELSLKENEKKDYTKKHSFEDLSTRKHYPGAHSITLIVNGTEMGTRDFELS
jgi:3-methyladenine DNA glycosylase AlkC